MEPELKTAFPVISNRVILMLESREELIFKTPFLTGFGYIKTDLKLLSSIPKASTSPIAKSPKVEIPVAVALASVGIPLIVLFNQF